MSATFFARNEHNVERVGEDRARTSLARHRIRRSADDVGFDRGGAVGDGVGRDLPTLLRDRLQHVPA